MREPNAVDKYVRINPTSKMIEPNWMYRDILPYVLGPDPGRFSSGIISLDSTGTTPAVVAYKLPHSSLGFDDAVGAPLQINQIVAMMRYGTEWSETDMNGTVFVEDPGDQRQYMNYPVHIETFAGSGKLSARLTEDLFLPTRHQLMVTFKADVSQGLNSNGVQLHFSGKLYDTWSSNLQKYEEDRKNMVAIVNKHLERRKYVTPYWLTTEGGAVTIPANQTVEVDTLIGDEGHFECSHILKKFVEGDINTAPFELELINPQTRQSLMNGRIHSSMIGNAQNPQPFPAPFLIPAGQILRFRITNLQADVNTVFLTLRGQRIRAPFKSRNEVEREFGNVRPINNQPSRKAEMAGVA